jgi:hypothetical protein
MNMEEIGLPQPVVLKSELAKTMGIPPEELVRIILSRNWADLPELPEKRGSWEGWIDFASQEPEKLIAALQQGYRFNYATIGGLRTLLDVKCGLLEGENYQIQGESAEKVPLTEQAAHELGKLLSFPWELTVTGESEPGATRLYRIAHRDK